jgi:LPS export ABC transporter protein LptC
MVFMVAMLFLSCSDSSKQDVPKDNFAEQNYPEVDATDFELVYTEKGIIRSLLSTPKLIKYETKERSYTEFPDGFHITKFDENKNKTSELSANYGKHFEKEKKWEALGNVIAINLDGDTLRTEHLIMLEKDNRIYSEKYVKITRKDQIITGIGFESDLDMNDYVVKEVKGTIYSGVE